VHCTQPTRILLDGKELKPGKGCAYDAAGQRLVLTGCKAEAVMLTGARPPTGK